VLHFSHSIPISFYNERYKKATFDINSSPKIIKQIALDALEKGAWAEYNLNPETGALASFMVTHGGEAYNFVETESGWEVERKAIEKARFGRDIAHMDRETIAHEYRIPSGTMNSYMSDRAPERLKELLTDQVLSDKDGWNEVAATQQYIAGAQFLNQMVGHKGEITTFTNLKGQGEAAIKGGEGCGLIFSKDWLVLTVM